MDGHRKPVSQRTKGKTPAERSEEFDARQAQLKAEAAKRREEAQKRGSEKPGG